jgi:type IV secretory pathway VirB6-like protein
MKIRIRYSIAIFVLACFFVSVFAPYAEAAFNSPFSCIGAGPGTVGPNASGNILTFDKDMSNTPGTGRTACDPLPSNDPNIINVHVFSRSICIFKQNLGTVMSSMYCSIQNALRVPLTIVVTLFIVIFGVMVATGMTRFTVREAMTLMFKVALVWAFAMDADWGIGLGYQFFITVADRGATWAAAPIFDSVVNNTGPVTDTLLDAPDQMLSNIANMFTGLMHGQVPTGGASSLPPEIANMPQYCQTILGILLILLLLIMPFILIFMIISFVLFAMLYARALLGYLTALVLISFLFVLAPFFLSFALFATTRKLFQRWIEYLTTFSLQMIVVFAFLAIVDSVPLSEFYVHLLGMVREYKPTFQFFLVTSPVDSCSICDYEFGPDTGGLIPDHDHPGAFIPDPNPSTGTVMKCKAPILAPLPPNQPTTNGDSILSAPFLNRITGATEYYWVIPFLSLFSHMDLIVFIVAQILALILIGNVLEDLFKRAPEMARQLGGLPFSAALTGRTNNNEGNQITFIGLESVEAGYRGFKKEFKKDPRSLNFPRRIIKGIQGAGTGFLYGEDDITHPKAKERLRAIEKQNVVVDEMRKKYVGSKRITVANYDDMQGAEEQYNAEKNKAKEASHDFGRKAEAYEKLRARIYAGKNSDESIDAASQRTLDAAQREMDAARPENVLLAGKRLEKTTREYQEARENEMRRKNKLKEAIDIRKRLDAGRPMLRGVLGTKDSEGNIKNMGSIAEGLGQMNRQSAGQFQGQDQVLSRLSGEQQMDKKEQEEALRKELARMAKENK